MLASGVSLTVVECAFGEEDHVCQTEGAVHIPVRARTRVWNKECLLNIGIHRTPEAKYIAWIDADVIFRRPDWALATLHALQHYDVVQPWSDALDLGPNGELMQTHKSFCRQYFEGVPVIPGSRKHWKHDGGPYDYAHCLPADSLVVPGGQVMAASSRPFEGDLVVIRTASGQEFSCSPNHPVFSGTGWVRADSLCVGDDVLHHVRGNGVVGKPDEKHPPARIEDIVRAFSERPGMHRRTHLLPNDLDGSVTDSKVAEVWTHRDLPTKNDTIHHESFGDLILRRIVKMCASRFNRFRTHAFLIDALGFPFPAYQPASAADSSTLLDRRLFEHSCSNSFPNLFPLRGGSVRPELTGANRPGFTGQLGRPQDVPGLFRNSFGNVSSGVPFVHADDPSALRSALSGQVERDNVVYAGRRYFSGHLYDLQTEHGYIIADRLLTHNSGYAWAMTRQAYDWVGGLFEVGGMGSGDHHMALSLVGGAYASMPGGTVESYRRHVKRWEARARHHINRNIGYVSGIIEHLFHGRKADRGYQSRWDMFLDHGFDPDEDLKRNSFGVLEWAGNKPELRREFDRYLQSRNEDINSL